MLISIVKQEIMRNIITLILLSATVSCAQKEYSQEQTLPPYDPDIPVLKVSMYNSIFDLDSVQNHPYDADFKVEQSDDGQYSLVTEMKLHGGSFFVSPTTDEGFKGKFRVEIAPNDDLLLGTGLTETPPTKTVIDPHRFVNGPVNWVTEDTRYEFPLELNTEDDFMIGGKLIFVIEPKCTLEHVPIMFKYKNGVLTVEPWEC